MTSDEPSSLVSQTSESVDERRLRAFCQEGDRDALGDLFAAHAECSWRVATRIAGRDAAEDVVHEAFLRVMAAAARRRPTGTVRGWMLAIVANTARQQRRATQRRRHHEGRVADWSEGASVDHGGMGDDDEPSEVRTRAVRQMIESLPKRYRLPVMLHHLDGLSVRDCAKVLSLREKTVYTRLRRGLEQLRERARRSGLAVTAVTFAAVAQVEAASVPPDMSHRVRDLAHHAAPATAAVGATIFAVPAVPVSAAATVLAVGLMAAWWATDSGDATPIAADPAMGVERTAIANQLRAATEDGGDTDGLLADLEADGLAGALEEGWSAAAFSPDGAMIATANGDRTITIRDRDGEPSVELVAKAPDVITCLAFGGNRLYAGDGTYTLRTPPVAGNIVAWNVADGSVAARWQAHPGRVHALAARTDGGGVVSVGNDLRLKTWDADGTLRSEVVLPIHPPTIPHGLALLPDGRVLVGDDAGNLHLHDPHASEPWHSRFLGGSVVGVQPAPGGQAVAVARGGRDTLLVSLPDLEPQRAFTGLADGAYRLQFSPGGAYLAAGGWGGDAAIWRCDRTDPIFTVDGAGGPVLRLEFAEDLGVLRGAVTRNGGPRTGAIERWPLRDTDGRRLLVPDHAPSN